MFGKKKCERCGKQYRLKTISENKGKHLCFNCVSHCSVCGKKLPRSNYYGETASITGALLGPAAGSLRDSRRPHIGSGMCNECFYKKQERKEEPPTPQLEEPSVRLKKLKALLDDELITKEEYEKRRSEILSQI